MDDSKRSQNDVDVWLIRDNLKLSYEERVAQHQATIDCVSDLHKIGQAHRERSQKPSRVSDKKPN